MFMIQPCLGVVWHGLASLKKVVCVQLRDSQLSFNFFSFFFFNFYFCEGMKAEQTGIV